MAPVLEVDPAIISPMWDAPQNIQAFMTTREGGVSKGVYRSWNLGMHVGDDPLDVAENRRRLTERLPQPPQWLNQVHGNVVRVLTEANRGESIATTADAVVTRLANVPCAVLVADCLPVLFAERTGIVVGAAHAGWRGLCAGVLENTVSAMSVSPESIIAWCGPAIGPSAFEVGEDVRTAFVNAYANDASAFTPRVGYPGKYWANIVQLARAHLARIGVTQVSGGEFCTVRDSDRFFSYRRDGITGRMAAVIWRR